MLNPKEEAEILESLASKLIAAKTEEEFWRIAQDWNKSPTHRDLLQDAIALADIPFHERCQMRRWFERGWRTRADGDDLAWQKKVEEVFAIANNLVPKK